MAINKIKNRNIIKFFIQFFKLESTSSVILLIATLAALFIANSPLHTNYEYILHYQFYGITIYHVINEGLMPIFFLVVSLEIKRELLEGELNILPKAILPIFAAIGGMIVPSLIYAAFNNHNSIYMHGWGIPSATDIAFSLAILRLLSSRIPFSLKIFLTALAITDDLGGIILIAVFYTQNLHIIFLIFAIVCLGILILFNFFETYRLLPYLLIGIILWICILKSGIHATIAGVVLGLTIPLYTQHNSNYSPLKKLEIKLHHWAAYGILPLFALANAGIRFFEASLDSLIHPVTLGIMLGLLFGKQLGVFLASLLAVKMGFAKLPYQASWSQFYGISILCGIGFTMSLFIGTLAFPENDPFFVMLVRLGVLTGSVFSAIMGYIWLRCCSHKKIN